MKRPAGWVTTIGFALLVHLSVGVSGQDGEVLAPGYGTLQFTPPAPGTYELPPLGVAVGGAVLNPRGDQLELADLLGDKLVLMGFIYTQCSDRYGCPLASYVMSKVQGRLRKDEELASRVRLISLSFDPQLDTPRALLDYSKHFRRKDFDWQFLTTASEQDLLPILEGYGQWRQKNYNDNGTYAGSMSHILRVFLIDEQRQVRNIYSTGFLHADTVMNDLRTLIMEPTDTG